MPTKLTRHKWQRAAILIFVLYVILMLYIMQEWMNVNIVGYLNVSNVINEIQYDTANKVAKYRHNCPEHFRQTLFKDQCWSGIHLRLKEVGMYLQRDLYCDKHNCSECVKIWKQRSRFPWFWQAFEMTKKERRQNISNILLKNNIYPSHNMSHTNTNNQSLSTVIVMSLNYGYRHIFANWVCSLHYNQIQYLKNKTFIIYFDEQTKLLLEQLGFTMNYQPKWFTHSNLSTKTVHITSQASIGGVVGMNALLIAQVAATIDLIQMGYHVLLQDVDLIWHKDPLIYFFPNEYNNEYNNEYDMKYVDNLDINMVDIAGNFDRRNDYRGPLNTGLIFIRNNCMTQVMMKYLLNYMVVIMFKDDQQLWNLILFVKELRELIYHLLPFQLFVPGYKNFYSGEPFNQTIDKHFYTMHASWTADHWGKIQKFNHVNQWYLTNQKCSIYFDENLLPDLKDRNRNVEYDAAASLLVRDTRIKNNSLDHEISS